MLQFRSIFESKNIFIKDSINSKIKAAKCLKNTFSFQIMMKSRPKTIALIILIPLFIFPFHIAVNLYQFKVCHIRNLDIDIESDLKRAEFWNFTGATILIDDTNPNYNWNKTVSENDWCNGDGSWSVIHHLNYYKSKKGEIDIPESRKKMV